jgi:hypothetical protein
VSWSGARVGSSASASRLVNGSQVLEEDFMRSTRALVAAFVALVVGAPWSLHAVQSPPIADQFLGTWQLNLAKSTYAPGPAPTSELRTYKRVANGIEGTINRRFRDGRSERIEYTADYDREYPVTGTEDYDHILLKRVDAYTSEAVLSHAGRIYGTARRTIARDGKTMTITLRSETASRTIVNVSVYDRVEP